MKRPLAAWLPLAFAVALLPACAVIDPQVGPSQESCGASGAGAGTTGGNTGYGSAASNGYGASGTALPGQTCSPDAGTACDDCESKYCCATRAACYADPVCVCADQGIDSCLGSNGGTPTVSSAQVAACWETFSSHGKVEQARVACER